MKKLILILAGSLCLGVATVQAQDPTQPATDSTTIEQPQPSTEAVPAAPAYRKDMVQVQATEIPAGLKSTLDRPQFKGWESGAIFSNADKNVFIVEIKDEVEGRVKAYRFDAEGKPITDN